MNLRPFARKDHVARYTSPAVYYSFVFSLPPTTDIYKLTDDLLRRNIADNATVGGSNRVRFAYRYEDKRKAQVRLRKIATFEEVVRKQVTFSRWALQNPSLAAWLVRKRLVKFRLRSSHSEPNQELIDQLRELSKTADDIDKEMLNEGLLTGAASTIDSTLFMSSYLATEPFIRLELGTIYAESEDRLYRDTDLVVFLLLHRSGTAILTFVAIPGEERTTDELLAVAASTGVRFTRTALPWHLGRVIAVDEQRVSSDKQTNSDNRAWRDISWGDPIPLQSLFEGLAWLVRSLVKKNQGVGEWMCYTTLFIDGLGCCGSKKEWMSQHAAELAGLVMRHGGYASVKKSVVEAVFANEHGLRENESDFFDIGNALLVTWDFGADIARSSPTRHFNTTAVVEGMLVKHWQLRTLDQRLSVEKWKPSNLEAIQRELITGLEEYRDTKLIWGSAREIEKQLGDRFELDRMYQNILDRIDALQKLIDTRTAHVANRRNILFAGISALAAVLLGMSAVKDILGVVSKINTRQFPGMLARPLVHFANSGDNGAWELYLILVSVVISVAVIGFFSRFTRERKKIVRSFGVGWDSISYSANKPTFNQGKEQDTSDNEVNAANGSIGHQRRGPFQRRK
jgi:hypothetical protein